MIRLMSRAFDVVMQPRVEEQNLLFRQRIDLCRCGVLQCWLGVECAHDCLWRG